MASRASPRSRKNVSKKRTIGDWFRKTLGRAPARNSRAGASEGSLFSRPIVFLVWMAAVAALAGLVHWGWSAKPERPPRTQAATKDTAPRPEKAIEHRESTQPREAARSRTAEKPDSNQGKVAVDKPVTEPQELTKPRKVPDEERHGSSGNSLHAALRPEPAPVEPSKAIPPSQPPPLTPPLARVAIVIDDFGQDLEIAKKFVELPIPVTLSVLPHLRHSREVAELAHEHHRQVILHLPMEPRGFPKVNPGKGALLLSMSDDAIHQSMIAALDASPYFTGVNNHMGSRFTEDATALKTVMAEAAKRRLFFIDSFTSPRSVAASLAQELQIPFRRRDIFLDNSLSEKAIRTQLRQLVRRAKIQGSALAIGHPHESTLRALRKEVDVFEREKIAVVPAGELMSGS